MIMSLGSSAFISLLSSSSSFISLLLLLFAEQGERNTDAEFRRVDLDVAGTENSVLKTSMKQEERKLPFFSSEDEEGFDDWGNTGASTSFSSPYPFFFFFFFLLAPLPASVRLLTWAMCSDSTNCNAHLP